MINNSYSRYQSINCAIDLYASRIELQSAGVKWKIDRLVLHINTHNLQ